MRRRTARDLAALADGTLQAERREALLRRVSKSSRLARALESQLIAVDAIRRVQAPAPAELHERIEALQHSAHPRVMRRPQESGHVVAGTD